MSELKIKNIEKSYKKKKVLKNINTIFNENKIYGLLGRNGAGKSTLMNLISNREFPTDGTITLNGEIVTENENAQSQIYLSSEKNFFNKDSKVKRILKTAELFFGDFDWELANQMISKFELDTNLRIGGLSTGYSSITKLIIALCAPVKYVLLDEPILGLDANHRDLFYEFMMETYTKRPRTFIVATHIIEEMEQLFEHIIIIKNGEIVDDDIDNLLNSAVILEGRAELITDIENKYDVFYSHSFSEIKQIYIKNISMNEELPDEIRIKRLNLQEYFVGRTNQ
ncbi:ATP-binding cassette domain-containing protein [Companilactobacillus sp. DQM5]|uniref:ATP-binding cassette domain-containing protein n=1 Tax=Companilactobacillus sp. DQM5 TaxID=3463359 RepID=UPI0040583B4F